MEDQIPFYGSQQQRLFQIERYAMDAPGKVVQYLNANLPRGVIMDLGAGLPRFNEPLFPSKIQKGGCKTGIQLPGSCLFEENK